MAVIRQYRHRSSDSWQHYVGVEKQHVDDVDDAHLPDLCGLSAVSGRRRNVSAQRSARQSRRDWPRSPCINSVGRCRWVIARLIAFIALTPPENPPQHPTEHPWACQESQRFFLSLPQCKSTQVLFAFCPSSNTFLFIAIHFCQGSCWDRSLRIFYRISVSFMILEKKKKVNSSLNRNFKSSASSHNDPDLVILSCFFLIPWPWTQAEFEIISYLVSHSFPTILSDPDRSWPWDPTLLVLFLFK